MDAGDDCFEWDYECDEVRVRQSILGKTAPSSFLNHYIHDSSANAPRTRQSTPSFVCPAGIGPPFAIGAAWVSLGG